MSDSDLITKAYRNAGELYHYLREELEYGTVTFYVSRLDSFCFSWEVDIQRQIFRYELRKDPLEVAGMTDIRGASRVVAQIMLRKLEIHREERNRKNQTDV